MPALYKSFIQVDEAYVQYKTCLPSSAQLLLQPLKPSITQIISNQNNTAFRLFGFSLEIRDFPYEETSEGWEAQRSISQDVDDKL